MGKKQSQGTRVKCVRVGHSYRNETLGDLQSGNSRFWSNTLQSIRDGAVEQRAGGGVRIIRKRTPE